MLRPYDSRPDQGWKLHISATPSRAEAVLERSLPVLFAEPVDFKVARSPQVLAGLNAGEGGISQIGKFVTVYPKGERGAVRLAFRLHEATRGLRGPAVPSDRPLRTGSLVSYRYGSFGRDFLRAPDAHFVPDDRSAHRHPLVWAADPFVAAGITEPDATRLVAGRYLVTTTRHRSPRMEVCVAVDVAEKREVILKRAFHDVAVDPRGRDARDYLRNEYEVLARLADERRVPVVYELFEDEGDLVLAMEHIDAWPAAQLVADRAARGEWLSRDNVIALGREVADILSAVHAAGIVHRDLKSGNVLVSPQQRVHLVDFDMAVFAGREPLSGIGTRGYVSLQQHRGRPVTPADDVYGLGALLFLLTTGMEPAGAPDAFHLDGRPLEILRPDLDGQLAGVIRRCLEPETADRFPSAVAVRDALDDIASISSLVELHRSDDAAVESAESSSRNRWLDRARRLSEWLDRTQPARTPWSRAHAFPVLYDGPAGTLLARIELAGAWENDSACDRVRADLDRYMLDAHTRPSFEDRWPGLYVGEAGLGVLLLRASQILGDEALLAAAERIGGSIAVLPDRSNDLMTGTAGRLRFHLMLFEVTGQRVHLEAARVAGALLLSDRLEPRSGEYCWPNADGSPPAIGYAHGAAGIADALLHLFEVTRDEQVAETAAGAARWLAKLAIPVLADRSGLDWPIAAGGPPVHAWCHGGTGVARFLLHASRLALIREAEPLARAGLRRIAEGPRENDPTQCHGLAGAIEALLDGWGTTRDPTYLDAARHQGRLLGAFVDALDGATGTGVHGQEWGPELMVGLGGVALCFLRLADPDRPALLSLPWIRHLPTPMSEAVST